MSIATTNPATGELLKSFEPISDVHVEDDIPHIWMRLV